MRHIRLYKNIGEINESDGFKKLKPSDFGEKFPPFITCTLIFVTHRIKIPFQNDFTIFK